MKLDLEGAFCKKYIELWFSLQNKHLKDKGKIAILDNIYTLTRSIEALLDRKIDKLSFPDYTPLIGNKFQANTVEYIYYRYVKRLLKIEEIIELMKECENDLKIYLSDLTYLDKKFMNAKGYI